MRYRMWAGIPHKDYLKTVIEIFDGCDPEDLPFESMWPIVDGDSCGEIDGYPRCFQGGQVMYVDIRSGVGVGDNIQVCGV